MKNCTVASRLKHQKLLLPTGRSCGPVEDCKNNFLFISGDSDKMSPALCRPLQFQHQSAMWRKGWL
uniref:Uncharacterized protein n=1 Tax=Anguilla anguilla TaxID=7936 RepID=A0A0E9RJK9_ANGAN